MCLQYVLIYAKTRSIIHSYNVLSTSVKYGEVGDMNWAMVWSSTSAVSRGVTDEGSCSAAEAMRTAG